MKFTVKCDIVDGNIAIYFKQTSLFYKCKSNRNPTLKRKFYDNNFVLLNIFEFPVFLMY